MATPVLRSDIAATGGTPGRARHRSGSITQADPATPVEIAPRRTWTAWALAAALVVVGCTVTLSGTLSGVVSSRSVEQPQRGIAADVTPGGVDAAPTDPATGEPGAVGSATGPGPGTPASVPPAAGSDGTGEALVERPGSDVEAMVEEAPAGATIRLAAGVYRIPATVTPKDGQTIVGVPGTVISGAARLESWQAAGGRWATTVPDRGGDPDSYDLYVDDVLLGRAASVADVGPGSWSLDARTGEVTVGSDPTGRRVELSIVGQAFGGSGVGVTISGMTIEKFATPAQQGTVSAVDGRDWTVTGNEVRFSHAAGVFVGSGSRVVDNVIRDNGQTGVKAWSADGLEISGNRIDGNNTLNFDPYWEAGGIKISNSRNVRIAGNEVFDNRGFGIWADYSGENIEYADNTIRGNELAGIHHEASFRAMIRGNTIIGNGADASPESPYAGAGIYVYDGRDVEITGNEISGNASGVVALVRDRGVATGSLQPIGERLEVRNLRVHDNTIEMSAGFSGLIVAPRGDEPPYALMDEATAQSYFTSAGNQWFDNVYRGDGYGESASPELSDPSARFVWGDPLGDSGTEAWTTPRYVGQTGWLGYGQDGGSSFTVTP